MGSERLEELDVYEKKISPTSVAKSPDKVYMKHSFFFNSMGTALPPLYWFITPMPLKVIVEKEI